MLYSCTHMTTAGFKGFGVFAFLTHQLALLLTLQEMTSYLHFAIHNNTDKTLHIPAPSGK